jgi:hypothetical protein
MPPRADLSDAEEEDPDCCDDDASSVGRGTDASYRDEPQCDPDEGKRAADEHPGLPFLAREFNRLNRL